MLLILIVFMTITPLLWMVSTSLKSDSETTSIPIVWIPEKPRWENYIRAWNSAPFGNFFLNSIKITLATTIGLVFFCSLAGYGFARFNTPLFNFLFSILLSAMMLPGVVMLIPLFILFRNIGWIDTHWSLIIPPMFANTFGTFLFRQFFLSIPKDFEEAAIIDGCSLIGVYWRIMMPLAKPAIATLSILSFMWNWNEFMRPLVFITSFTKMTVSVGLSVFQGQFSTYYNLLMAASTLSLIPIFIVYLFAQKYFTQGLVMSGIKG
jgi:multiple sugar transport system permease protein